MTAEESPPSDTRSHIILIGPMGVGKTTCGVGLAHLLDLPFHDSDEWIETHHRRSGRDIAAADGVAALHDIELAAFIDMSAGARAVIAPAESVVDDGRGRSILLDNLTVWLRADTETLHRRRAQGDHRRPISDAELATRRASRIEHLRACATIVEDTSSRSPDAVVASIAARLDLT